MYYLSMLNQKLLVRAVITYAHFRYNAGRLPNILARSFQRSLDAILEDRSTCFVGGVKGQMLYCSIIYLLKSYTSVNRTGSITTSGLLYTIRPYGPNNTYLNLAQLVVPATRASFFFGQRCFIEFPPYRPRRSLCLSLAPTPHPHNLRTGCAPRSK